MKVLLTQNQLSRKADINIQRVQKAVKAGLIEPDFKDAAGRLLLFKPDRLETIRQLLASKPEVVCQQG